MFGEATEDDLDDDPDLEEHKSKCECPPVPVYSCHAIHPAGVFTCPLDGCALLRSVGCGLLHPRTTRSHIYDFVQMIFLWYIVGMVPWRIAFEFHLVFPEKLWFLEIFVDCAILFDICLNMRRYFFDNATHKLVTDNEIIRREYIRSWFLIDSLSIFPFDFVVSLIHSGEEVTMSSSTKMIRLARMARFARLFRLTKLANLRKFTSQANETLRRVGLTKPSLEFFGRICFLAGIVCLVTHVIACLWINLSRDLTIVADPRDVVGTYDARGEEGLLNNWYSQEYGIGDAARCKLDHPDYPEEDCDNHLMRIEMIPGYDYKSQEGHWRVYADGSYWILTTMSTVGYGEILPFNTTERIFACWVIMVGAFVWAYIVGSFSSTLANMDRDKAKYDEEMRSIKAMMSFHEVPMELAMRIDAYFEYKFETHTMFDDDAILEAMPTRIRNDFILHRYNNTINMIPFFRGCREDAIIEIVARFKSFSVLPADYLFHAGDPTVDLCVLTKGRMAMVANVSDKGGATPTGGSPRLGVESENMEAEYFPGAFFGENEFLGFGRERSATIRARTFCEVSTLHPEDMEPVLAVHVTLRRRLEKYAKLKAEMEKGLQELGGEADLEALMDIKEGIEDSWEEQGKELQEAWESITKDDQGRVRRKDIGPLVVILDRPMKEWELDNAMHVMDADGNGAVDFDEFAAWWEKNDAQLKFTTWNPQEEHNKTMRAMSEASLGLLHDVMTRLDTMDERLQKLEKKK